MITQNTLTWIVGGFNYTEEESREQETHVVLGETGSDRDDGPSHHDGDEEGWDLDTGDQHVGGDTSDDITDKQDRDTGLVLYVA